MKYGCLLLFATAILTAGPTLTTAASGPGLSYFERDAPEPALLLRPLDPASPEALSQIDPGRFEPLVADQDAERQMLWVRQIIARHASDADVRAALNRIDAWHRQVWKLRVAAGNPQALSASVRAAPHDVHAIQLLAAFWVSQIQLERGAILGHTDPRARLIVGNRVRLDIQTGNWEWPVDLMRNWNHDEGAPRTSVWHSRAFPAARSAVEQLLSEAPNDAQGLYLEFELYRYSTYPIWDVVNRAAVLTGPYAATARIYVLTRDTRVSNLRGGADTLRRGRTESRTGLSPQGDHVIVRVHIPPTSTDLARASALERQADQLEAAQRLELETTVAHEADFEPIFLMMAEMDTSLLANDAIRDRVLRHALLLDPSDWRVFETYAEMFSGQPTLRQSERAADAAQQELRTESNVHPIQVYQDQVSYKNVYFSYVLARRALRRNPTGCAENAFLGTAMEDVDVDTAYGAPVIPDAAAATRLQWKLDEYACIREMDLSPAGDAQLAGKQLEATKRELARLGEFSR